jgi:transcriptional regulator with XRE-family HTH domain
MNISNVCKLPISGMEGTLILVDLDKLIGSNLRRIREARGLSQSRLAEMIGTTPQRLSSYETGRDGMGKDYMERVCKALIVDPWEFYWTEKTPIVRDANEMADILQRREAEKVGIADMVREAEASWIVAAKKKKDGPGGKSPAKGVPRHGGKSR